jgi:hypothetical protein
MKYFIVAIAICFGSVACQKDSSSSSGTTKTDLITKSSWKFEDVGGDANKDGTIDLSLSSQLPDCVKDNFLTLSSNGSGVVDEGTLKCDVSDPQTTAVTWSFANNESSLNLGGAGIIGIGGQFKIVTLNETNLSLSKDTTLQGLPVALVVKLKH